jgi:hypothetical protein
VTPRHSGIGAAPNTATIRACVELGVFDRRDNHNATICNLTPSKRDIDDAKRHKSVNVTPRIATVCGSK